MNKEPSLNQIRQLAFQSIKEEFAVAKTEAEVQIYTEFWKIVNLLKEGKREQASNEYELVRTLRSESAAYQGLLIWLKIRMEGPQNGIHLLIDNRQAHGNLALFTFLLESLCTSIASDEDYLKQLDKLIQDRPEDAGLLRFYGDVKSLSGDFETAIAYYSQALEQGTDSLWCLCHRGECRLYIEDYVKAEEDFSQALHCGEPTAKLWWYLGLVTQGQNRYADSVKAFVEALKLAPDYSDCLASLAKSLFLLGEVDDALHWLEESAVGQPMNSSDHCLLGSIHASKGDHDAAMKAFQTALELDPDSIESWEGIIKLDDSADTTSQALEAIDQYIGTNPKLSKGYLVRANILSLTNRGQEALHATNRGLAVAPSSLSLRQARVLLNIFANIPEEAVADAIVLKDLQPRSANCRAVLGVTHILAGHMLEAETEINQALSMDTKHGESILLRAFLHNRLGRTSEALTYLSRYETAEYIAWEGIGRLCPGDWYRGKTLLGMTNDFRASMSYIKSQILCQAVGDSHIGLLELDQACSFDPSFVEAGVDRARLRLRLGVTHADDALKELEKAIEISEGSLYPKICCGEMLLELGKVRDANAMFEDLVRDDRGNALALYYSGICKLKMGQEPDGWLLIERSAVLGFQDALDLLAKRKPLTNGNGPLGGEKRSKSSYSDQDLVDAYIKTIDSLAKPKPTQSELFRMTGIPQPTWSKAFHKGRFRSFLEKSIESRSSLLTNAWIELKDKRESNDRITYEKKTLTSKQSSHDTSSEVTGALDNLPDTDGNAEIESVEDDIDRDQLLRMTDIQLRREIVAIRPDWPDDDLKSKTRHELLTILKAISG